MVKSAAKTTVEEALEAAPLPEIEEAPSQGESVGTPDIAAMVRAEVQGSVASAVEAAMAAILPGLLNVVQQGTPQFSPGMGPSQNVQMQIGFQGAAEARIQYLKHYRLDDTPSAKFIVFNMDKVDSGVDPNDAVLKGQWIHFQNGHFYANSENEVRNVEYMIRTNPQCKIYEDMDPGLIPCTAGCNRSFATEAGLMAHLAATHGMR